MDLTKIGTYLFMALIAVVICMIINIFMQNSTFDLIISIVAIIIFVGFTAYDVQKLIKLGTLNVMNEDNLAIYNTRSSVVSRLHQPIYPSIKHFW